MMLYLSVGPLDCDFYRVHSLTSDHITSLPYSHVHCTPQNPDGFDPDRWAPGAVDEEKLKELFTPFALGKRNCVGQNLAKIELKLVLATLYKSFSFELVSEVSVDYFLTLKPANAHMKVHAGKC
jgi:cytochrome P450